MPVTIPTPTSTPLFELQVELDGVTYTLNLRWNGRAGAWFIHLMDAEGAPLVMGRKVVVSFPLFNRFRRAGTPPGLVVAADTAGTSLDPGLDDLGARVQLQYVPAAELV